ncbi:zinc-binding dehydrogenase, partial [Spirillospora sp. NPDC049652]
AEALGADEVLDPAVASPYTRWAELGVPVTTVDRIAAEIFGTAARGAVIFECVGVPGVLRQVIDGAPAGATVMLVGVCMQPDTVEPGVAAAKEITVRGTFGAMPEEYRATLHDIGAGRIDAGAVITGEVGLPDLDRAFRDLANPERHAKIIVRP